MTRMNEILAFTLHIGTALLLGMAIGLERQFRQHPAGLRTNALVCLGAALFVSLGRLLGHEADALRIAAQVVSGIGFLGAGVILREGLNVRGMNTAATLWCSAAIGTLAGLGLTLEAAVGTAAILLLHLALRPVVQRINAYVRTTGGEVEALYRLRVVCSRSSEGVIRAIFMRHINSQPHMTLQGIATQDSPTEPTTTVVAEIYSAQHSDKYMNEMVSRLSIEPGVTAASWEKTT
jgi:putative Mg2+ transporter-C (MgtC) family protein